MESTVRATFFRERILPLLCLLVLSTTRVEEKWLKTQRYSASHARDRWEFRNPCLVRDWIETERKNVRFWSVRLLSRRSNVRNINLL